MDHGPTDKGRTIILLAGAREEPFLREFLLERNASLRIETPRTIDSLRKAVADAGGRARILSFLNDLIVPSDVLEALSVTPYNVHPGPPEYPGAHAESFAIWEGAARYGVTAHEMAARVDEGRIVALSRFDMPPRAGRKSLGEITLRQALKVFAVVAAHCAGTDAPMAPMAARWSGVKRARKDFRALCRSYASTPPADRDRLRRACAEDLEGTEAA